MCGHRDYHIELSKLDTYGLCVESKKIKYKGTNEVSSKQR